MIEAVKTGYPSIDQPWNKYFDACDGGKKMGVPQETILDYLKKCNKDNLDGIALDFFGHTISYREFFGRVEEVAKALHVFGVKPGEIIDIITINAVETSFIFRESKPNVKKLLFTISRNQKQKRSLLWISLQTK